MSGLVGFTGKFQDAENIARAMMARIAHRGPDAQGLYVGDVMTLGHRNLALRKDGATQPVMNEDSTLVAALDGEIMNATPLRDMLAARGHTFSSNSSAEIVVHMYEEYGTAMVSHLMGAFAFVIYDMHDDVIFAARDPLGVKPLYYYPLEGEIAIASEMKAMLAYPDFTPAVNTEALAQYLTFQYNPLAQTMLQGVYKLLPGHYLVFENGGLTVSRYFSPMFTPQDMTLDDATEMVDIAVRDSVQRHTSCDVPVGALLSGGVDSGYVAAVMSGYPTFTVGFDDMGEKYNEIPLARRLADSVGLENISQNITADEYFAALQDVQYFMDEPLADPAAVPLYFATRLAAENGIKVLLSGEGADELFAGYGVYQQPIHTAGYRALPLGLRRWIAGLAEKMQPGRRGRAMLMRGAQPIEEHYIGGAYVFSPQELETLLIAPPHKYPEDITRPYYDRVRYEDEITKMQCLDISLWLPGDILAKADKMAAAHGITIRTPLACREVLRAATRLPLKFRVGKHETKIAFRRAAGAHIPTETAERPKLGFPVPLAQWLRDEKYIAPIRDAFNGDTAQEYFHTVSLTTLLDTHSSGKRDLSRGIWAIYCFLVWHDEYFHEKNQQ